MRIKTQLKSVSCPIGQVVIMEIVQNRIGVPSLVEEDGQ